MSNFYTRPDWHISFFQRGRIRVSPLRLEAPAFLDGLRAVFVADVHLRRSIPDAWLEGLLRQIAALAPDLLLLGGDYSESPDQQERFFAALGRQARPRLGSFGVLGNNDREQYPDPGDLRAVMARSGVRLLLNEHALLPVNGQLLAIAGVDEEKYGEPQSFRVLSDCARADYRVLLAHMPLWPDAPADLILSGHTHGGQLNFLGLTPYSIGFEAMERYPLVKGVAEKDGATLLVSRGLGYSRLPLRVGAYPEIHVIDFAASGSR